jgi:hypothetical protein
MNTLILIGQDGRCDCTCACKCPLGKAGSSARCFEGELHLKGIGTIKHVAKEPGMRAE